MGVPKAERRAGRSEQRSKRVSAGCCPYCKFLFTNPVTLTCGHSLCGLCCQELLERRIKLNSALVSQSSTVSLPNAQSLNATPIRTPVMGIRVLSELTSVANSSNSQTPVRSPAQISTTIRQPECIVCGNPESASLPIKNHALAQLLRKIQRMKRETKLATYNNPLYSLSEKQETSPRPSSSSSGFESETNVDNVCICKLNIMITGDKGVGKTELTRTQYLNNLFFGRIEAEKSENTASDESNTELFAKYLIHIIDQPDFTKPLTSAHGFILLYSITNKESFEYLTQLINDIKLKREDAPPMIVVGTKSDLKETLRQVSSFEGQQFARVNNCAFFEVSAKENDCVNEVFNHIVQLIDAGMSNKVQM